MKRILLSNQNRKEVIGKAIKILNSGGVVIYPTETCYGIAVDATNENALSKLLQYKKFRGSKPISVAVSDIGMASKYVDINEMAKNIYSNYLPGPITVISKSLGILEPPVVSKQGSVGIRIPDYEFTLELIKEFGKPLTATSANVSYKSHPYSIEQLIKDLPQRSEKLIDMYIDVGELPRNVPSTIVDTTMNSLTILREGKLQFENAIVRSPVLEHMVTDSAEDTVGFGKLFSDTYLSKNEGGIVVALSGELGAGKTQFTKGIGLSLGVKEIINSPTYTIINEYIYNGNTLAHMDTWRLTDYDDLNKSGLVEHLKEGNIVVIEWADKFYQEIQNLCTKENIPMYKVNFKYITLEKRDITVYGFN